MFLTAALLAFDGNGQPVTYSEHAQIDPLVLVQLLIQSIQKLGDGVIGSGIDDISTPQHLQKDKQQCFNSVKTCSPFATRGTLTLSIAMMPPFRMSSRDFS